VQALSLDDRAVALIDEIAAGARLLSLAVDPAARGRGLARRLLGAIAGRYPPGGVSIIAVVPERTGTPVFASAGWTRTELGQHEMEHRLRPAATG
jgi:GNAT superfamily N-acetyltransferase